MEMLKPVLRIVLRMRILSSEETKKLLGGLFINEIKYVFLSELFLVRERTLNFFLDT
jgi:hypothetical protein